MQIFGKSQSMEYTLRKSNVNIYDCTCSVWRANKERESNRTCMHLRHLRGEAEERDRVGERGILSCDQTLCRLNNETLERKKLGKCGIRSCDQSPQQARPDPQPLLEKIRQAAVDRDIHAIECLVCWNEYQPEGPMMPKVMPCGHSLCMTCLDIPAIRFCPTCYLLLPVTPAKDFPTNYALKDQLELLNQPPAGSVPPAGAAGAVGAPSQPCGAAGGEQAAHPRDADATSAEGGRPTAADSPGHDSPVGQRDATLPGCGSGRPPPRGNSSTPSPTATIATGPAPGAQVFGRRLQLPGPQPTGGLAAPDGGFPAVKPAAARGSGGVEGAAGASASGRAVPRCVSATRLLSPAIWAPPVLRERAHAGAAQAALARPHCQVGT